MALRPDAHAAGNLTNTEKAALRTLQNNPTFLIKEADKGGDPTQIFKRKLDRLLEAARGYDILSKQELNFLTVPHPIIPTFYMVPKIHKNAQIPPVLDLPSYLRDSTSVLQEFAEVRCEEQMYLVTCDVEALYSNIQSQHDISIDFLDLTLTIQEDHITTTLYRKPTATNSLLEYGSFHPQHQRDGIPTGQFLRIKRNCSEKEDFKLQAQDLTQRFLQRGYPKKVVSKAFQRAKSTDRATLLQPRRRHEQKEVRIISTYNNQWPAIRDILRKNWSILHSDIRLQDIVSKVKRNNHSRKEFRNICPPSA